MFATKLLDAHKKSIADQLKKTVTTNFVQEDMTSIASGSDFKPLSFYDISTNETYQLTVSPDDYERAQIGQCNFNLILIYLLLVYISFILSLLLHFLITCIYSSLSINICLQQYRLCHFSNPTRSTDCPLF